MKILIAGDSWANANYYGPFRNTSTLLIRSRRI